MKVAMGQPEYEQTLHQTRMVLENANYIRMDELVKIKALINFNLIYMRAKDLPLESCMENLKTYIDELNNQKPTEVELTCRRFLTFLYNTLEKNIEKPLYQNTKLKKLVELVLRCHNKDSRGKKLENDLKCFKLLLNRYLLKKSKV